MEAAGWRYGTIFISIADLRNAGGDFPKAYVTKALAEGKPVPAYVLASYPDLVLKYGNPVENTPQARLRQDYEEGVNAAKGEGITPEETVNSLADDRSNVEQPQVEPAADSVKLDEGAPDEGRTAGGEADTPAGAGKAKIKYIHNPSENPKVLRVAVEDPDAVYGYKPSETGSLKQFADRDWSDPQVVNDARQQRVDYHNKNEADLQSMRDQGLTDDQIAKQMVEQRNQNRLNSYMDEHGSITDQEGYNQALGHNKSYEQLKAAGKTDQDIIKSSTKGNPGMDACTGLYDDYFDTY